jgi:hypothetical protein
MKLLFLLITLFFLLHAEKNIDFDYEADIYYSNASLFWKFPDENITDASEYSEVELYTDLAKKIFSSNIFLVEIAAHPMPIAGLIYRNSNEEPYTKDKIQNFNPVKTLTAGFEEPYSISFFVGRMMVFAKERKGHIGKNRAYMGYLLTFGDYSIKDNRAYYNRWSNFEVKLKGTRELEKDNLDWSFRVGARFNENRDFTDSYYFGLRRNRIDFEQSFLSWFYNSAFEIMTSFSANNLELMENQIMLEKIWPASSKKHIAFGLGIGYLYTSGAKYNGLLADQGIDNHQIIIRPNIKF